MALNICSEIGRLKRVIIHTPGNEIEAMCPKDAEEDLYNDIIPLEITKGEHAELKAFLSSIAKVYEVGELLEESLRPNENRKAFVDLLTKHFSIAHRKDELSSMDSKTLTKSVIQGLKAEHVTVESYLRGRAFDLKPLPNLYFMRDSALVYRNSSVSCAMRFDVRFIESLITRFIMEYHADFSGKGLLFNGPDLRAEGFSLEGGDLQVISANLIAIGMSERTSPKAVDYIAKRIAETYDEPLTILAVDLPKERATIHLDMVFTMIDKDACLVYEPLITGKDACRVIRMDINPKGSIKIRDAGKLLDALVECGHHLQPVLAGGKNPVHQSREQWLSGANSFSFAPGKIIMYSCNLHTLESLSNAGFAIKNATEFTKGSAKIEDFKRLVVGFEGVELARGGGGARCMTMPVEREAL